MTALLIHQLFQHGGGWRLDCQVVTIAGALELTRFVAHKRTGDNPANVVATFGQLFTGDFAQRIETIQTKGLFMTGDLEH